jgi:hypothetical protein
MAGKMEESIWKYGGREQGRSFVSEQCTCLSSFEQSEADIVVKGGALLFPYFS